MDVHFMKSYVQLLVQTCHKRGAHAMGGMAAQIPSKDPELNKHNLEKVYNDKKKEAMAGMDGTWIAHPGLYDSAYTGFQENRVVDGPNQLLIQKDYNIKAEDLLLIPNGNVTSEGVRINVHAFVKYIESWLNGVGAVAINSMMEDAATAEISRMQIWQWVKHQVNIGDNNITLNYVIDLVKQETNNNLVIALVTGMLDTDNPDEFLTLEAYKHIP